MKKTLALLFVASVVSALLVGCDSAPKDDAAAPATTATTAGAPVDKTPKMDDAE